MKQTTPTKRPTKQPAKQQQGSYFTYLVDISYFVVATIAENVSQSEAKRIASETACDAKQLIVVSCGEWQWYEENGGCDLPIEQFGGIDIRKAVRA